MEILRRDGEKVTCGYLGLRVIFHVLSDFGESELAYRMITGKEYPSYGYFVEQGDTTLPEQFLPDEARRKMSQNHHFLGDITQWYIRNPGGINVIHSRQVSIRPKFIGSLSHVTASHRLPDGEVRVSWERRENGILLEVACPESVACDIALEDGGRFGNGKRYLESGTGRYEICLE